MHEGFCSDENSLGKLDQVSARVPRAYRSEVGSLVALQPHLFNSSQ